jgi:HEAT repeat protein
MGQRKPRSVLLLALALSLSAGAAPLRVLAQDKPVAPAAKAAKPSKASKAAAKKRPKLDAKTEAQLATAQKQLQAGEREAVEAGIQSLGLLGVEAAVAPLVARIEQGLPNDLLETAVVTLMALGQPSAGPALFDLARYRRAEIRLRAVEAIAAVRPSGGEAALREALSDGDAAVRSAAAVGLGEVGTSASIDTLFLALDHGIMEAAAAIGKLVPARDVKRLFAYLGKVPFRSMAPAFAEAIKRSDVSESDKLAVIARLEEVGTGEVKAFFGDVMASTEGKLAPNVSRAMLRAMQEIAER